MRTVSYFPPLSRRVGIALFIVMSLILGIIPLQSVTARAQTSPSLPTASTSSILSSSGQTVSSTSQPVQSDSTPPQTETTTSVTIPPVEPTTSTTQPSQPVPDASEPTATTTLPPGSPTSSTLPSSLVPNTITLSPSTTSTTFASAKQTSSSSTSTSSTSSTTSTSTTIPWLTITHELGEYPSIKNIQLEVDEPVVGISLFTDGVSRAVVPPTYYPDLPDGLSISPTGQLTGTPTESHTYQKHFLTCRPRCPDAGFGLEVVNEKDVIIDFPESPHTLKWSIHERVDHPFWHVRGGDEPYTFSITPPLPVGLTLDRDSGIISGQAISAQDRGTYTLTVTDASPISSMGQFGITIEDDMQPRFTEGDPTVVLEESTVVLLEDLNTKLPVATGGDGPISYSIEPHEEEDIITLNQLQVRIDRRIEEVSLNKTNWKRDTRTTIIPMLRGSITGEDRELGTVILVARDSDGDQARIDLHVSWEQDSIPEFSFTRGSMFFKEAQDDRRRIPGVIGGNPPFRFHFDSVEKFPEGGNMSISGIKLEGSKYTRDELDRIRIHWRRQDPSKPEFPRTVFAFTVTDKNGDSISRSFHIMVQNKKPTLDNPPTEVTWVVNQRITPITLKLKDKVGTLCILGDTFNHFPPGIEVSLSGRDVIISGTPTEAQTSQEHPYYLVFGCRAVSRRYSYIGHSFVKEQMLNITIEDDFQIALADSQTQRAAWQRKVENNQIQYDIVNGNAPFKVVGVSPDFPDGIIAESFEAENCDTDDSAIERMSSPNTITTSTAAPTSSSTTMGGANSSGVNSSIAEVGYCIKIIGAPTSASPDSEDTYTVTIIDNGNETLELTVSVRVMSELIPENDQGFGWIEGIESYHPVIGGEPLISPRPITFRLTTDEFTEGWLNLTDTTPIIHDGNYEYSIALEGTTIELSGNNPVSGIIEITAMRTGCDQNDDCEDGYFDDIDSKKYRITVFDNRKPKFEQSVDTSYTDGCVVANNPISVNMVGNTIYLPSVLYTDGTVIYKDITPALPIGLRRATRSTVLESGESVIQQLIVGDLEVAQLEDKVYTFSAVDNNQLGYLSDSNYINSFLETNNNRQTACYKFKLALNSSGT